jgi:hypothetical protein
MPPGPAALMLALALALMLALALALMLALALALMLTLALMLVLARARGGLVAGVARWHGAARADRSARSHPFAGRPDVAGSRGLAGRHRVAGPRRLSGSHVITGRHGGWRLTAGGIRRPPGTARVHPRLVARTRRRRSSPAGRRPVLAPPAGRRSWSRRGSGGPQDFRDALTCGHPGRATVPGHVEQAAR